MHWSDLLLRLIRAAGALASALAGIAALLTDGAFLKRERPPAGWRSDLPFAEYRVTRKGAILLAVILAAPMVQFVGDWIKDVNDTTTLNDTAGEIRKDVDTTVQNTSQLQLDVEKKAIDQETVIGVQASGQLVKTDKLLTEEDRSIHRFDFVDLSFLFSLETKADNSLYSSYLERLREATRNVSRNPEISILGLGYWESSPPKSGFLVGVNGETTIYPGSELLPNRETKSEQATWDNLHNYSYTLLFYRESRIDISSRGDRDFKSLGAPDLTIDFSAQPDDEDRLRLVFNPKSSNLTLLGKQLRRTRADWSGTGTIVGGKDLAGVRLILKVYHEDLGKGLGQIMLNIGNEFQLDQDDFRNMPSLGVDHSDPDAKFYEFRFPEDGDGTRFRLAKLDALRHREQVYKKEYGSLVAGRWCDLNSVWALIVREGMGREQEGALCRADVSANGGRAPVSSERDDIYDDQLDWKHEGLGSDLPITCSCQIDVSRLGKKK